MKDWYFELLKADSNTNTGCNTLESKNILRSIIESEETPVAQELSMFVLSKIYADKNEQDMLRIQLSQMQETGNKTLEEYAQGYLAYLDGNHSEARQYFSNIIQKAEQKKPGLLEKLKFWQNDEHIRNESDEEMAERQLEEEVYKSTEQLSKKLRRPTEKMVCAVKENKMSSIATCVFVAMVGYSGSKNWHSIEELVSGIHFPSLAQAQTLGSMPEETYNMPRAEITEQDGIVKLITKYDDGRQIGKKEIYKVTWTVDGKDYTFFPDENGNYDARRMPRKNHQYTVSATIELQDRSTISTNTVDIEKKAAKHPKKNKKLKRKK